MAINFSNSPGNLFNVLGKLGAIIKNVKNYQNTQNTSISSSSTGALTQLLSAPDIQAVLGNNYLSGLSAPESICPVVAGVAEQYLNRIVFNDNPRLGQTLTKLDTIDSIIEVIRQMKVEGATVLQMTIGSSVTGFTGIGIDSAINVSTNRPLDGRSLENSFVETLTFVCVTDSYTGGANPGNEGFVCLGAGSQSDYFAFNWPLGSGASVNFNSINGDANASQGNILTNSNFNTGVVTANVPDSFTLNVGTAGTNTALNGSITFGKSLNSLQIIGDGTTLTELRQVLTGLLKPLTQYGVCIFMRRDTTATAQGTLNVELCDGNGNTITDAAGNPNSYSINLTALSTNFAGFVGQFRTPTILPSVYSIRLREPIGAALSNGRSVYAAKLSLGLMNQLYAAGPYVSTHSGSLPSVQNDYASASITNSRGAGGTLSTFQTLMAQLFSNYMINQGFLLPSAANPSIQDTLIA